MTTHVSRPSIPSRPSSAVPLAREPLVDPLEKAVPSVVPLPSTRRARTTALGVLLLLTFVAVARLVSSLWEGLALGSAMAFTAQPIFRRMSTRVGRRWLSALVTTLLTGIAWIVVGGGTLYVLAREAVNVAIPLRAKIENGRLQDVVGPRVTRLLDTLHVPHSSVMHALRARVNLAADDLATGAAAILTATGSALLAFVIGLMTMYYVLMEWPKLTVRLERILPIDPRHTRRLIAEFRAVGRSAMLGSIATAVVQGVLGGLAYWLLGVPHPTTFGLLTFIGSFLPAVGTALVWAPLGIWLIVTGSLVKGLLLLGWGLVVVVGVCDYLLRPRLVGKEEHPLLTLLALLGGLEVFGLAGLLAGPIVMALFLATMRLYERERVVDANMDPPNVPEKL